ncbi:MAG: heme ABC exporter ATP-binding protein CcmA [Thermodesulfobacteriota bacterium]
MPEIQDNDLALLQARGLGKAYGPRLVFRDLDFELFAGELILVLGANGSGKSTLLQLACGLLKPSKGSIELELDPSEVGYMGHSTFVYSGLSALENLRFWSRLYRLGGREQDLQQILRRVGLGQYRHEPAANFSRGMAQRLSLARVLLISPRLFLLDEPATGLDQDSQQILRQEILQAREKGAAALWVSHNPHLDLDLASGTLCLQGKSGYLAREPVRGQEMEEIC